MTYRHPRFDLGAEVREMARQVVALRADLAKLEGRAPAAVLEQLRRALDQLEKLLVEEHPSARLH